MDKYKTVGLCVILVLSITIWHASLSVFAQSQSTANPANATSGNASSTVSVEASVTVPVNNDTLKAREGMLRSSVTGFLNSGANVLKTPDSDQPIVRTVITNKINGDAQNVQGTEATNAIIGVEITKALKTISSSTDNSTQTNMVTIQTSSTCKPSAVKSISCENTVTIS